MKLTKADIEHMRMLRGELTKLRCWMTGFHAGRDKGNLPAPIPGEDSLRMTISLIDKLAPRQALKGGSE